MLNEGKSVFNRFVKLWHLCLYPDGEFMLGFRGEVIQGQQSVP